MSLRGGRGTRVLVLLLLYIGMSITIYQCFPKAVRWPYGFISPRALPRVPPAHILHARMHARLKN